VTCPGAEFPDGFYHVGCSTYIRCVKGRHRSRIQTCPAGERFSPGFQRCMPAASVACLTDTPVGMWGH
jgi:hypothetical protein